MDGILLIVICCMYAYPPVANILVGLDKTQAETLSKFSHHLDNFIFSHGAERRCQNSG